MDASSFLEADSFLDLPPLRSVNKNFSLSNLCTMLLGETLGTKYEFGNIQQVLKLVSNILFAEFYTEDILATLVCNKPYFITFIFLLLCRASRNTQT